MRRITLCLFTLLLAAAPALSAPAGAPASTSPAKPAASTAPAKPAAQAAPALPDETAAVPAAALQGTQAQLYQWATGDLEVGLWYVRAEAQLKAALKQDPDNAQYHLALGCAEADRAASIGYANSWRMASGMMQSIYPAEIDAWEKGQKDPKSPYYGTPKPNPAPQFKVWTKDDYRTLILTQEQATASIAALAKSATAEWAQAVSLSKTPDERANAEYVQGWGLRLLEKTQGAGGMGAIAGGFMDIMGSPNTNAIKSFEAATKDEPGSATYWQSLGDALYRAPGFSDLIAQYAPTLAPPAPKPGDITALDAYQHALQINSGNPAIHYRIYELEASSDPAHALDDLKLAASGEPDNAYLAYEAAFLEFKQSKFAGVINLMDIIRQSAQSAAKSSPKAAQGSGDSEASSGSGDGSFSVTVTHDSGSADSSMPNSDEAEKQGDAAYQDDHSREVASDAVALIDQGNTAAQYYPFVYTPAVPKMLAVAWGYGSQVDMDPSGGMDIMQLAMDACQYATAAAKAGDVDNALEAARAVTSMGLKMMSGTMSSQQIAGWGMGGGAASMGYSTLEQIYQLSGDQQMAQQVKAEADAFEAQMRSSAMQQMQNWMQSFFGSY